MKSGTIKLCFLFLLLSLAACKSRHNGGNKDKVLPEPLQGSWYKRYSGTVAGQPVTVNMHHYADGAIGFYNYTGKSVIIDLVESEDTVDKFAMHLREFVRTSRAADEDNYKPDHWSVNFTGSEVNGKWTSGDNAKIEAIDLKEDYPAGSYPLDIVLHQDSASERKGITNTVAVSSYEILQPAPAMPKADAGFLQQSILHILGADTLGATDLRAYMAKEDKKYFSNYKKLLADIQIDRDNNEEWQYNFEHIRNMWVLYNAGGMLSLELHEYDYSGGGSGHGNFWATYACIDIQQKKIWRLDDMVRVSATDLLPLLAREARRIYKLGPEDNLSDHLAVSAVPLTQNVFATETGITFCYNPMELGTGADGEVCLFLPYNQLKGLLKDDFKKRMGLQ